MVRVISVHNFPKQDVCIVGHVISGCFVPPSILLLARTNHLIQVFDTVKEKSGYILNVDQPFEVQHSLFGNYIACMEACESKNSIRIYMGWETTLNGPVTLRARIAGRVTPGPALEANQIDMLELPIDSQPIAFSVCPISGNLAAVCNTLISLWKCEWRREGGRPDFFDLCPIIKLKLSFIPIHIRICEDIIAAGSANYLHIFALAKKISDDVPDKTVQNDRFVFPSVEAESGRLLKASYLTVESELTVNLVVKDLLQLQLASFDYPPDKLDFFCLKPYYLTNSNENRDNGLGSEFIKQLYGVSCFFATQQEGYLYCFESNKMVDVITYPLTAPLIDVVLEDCVLHALTEAGLETYTLPALVPGKVSIPETENVCLLGLRQFVGAEKMILGGNYLWLLTKAPAANDMTLYTLTLPSVSSLWNDFLAAAEPARWDAPSTFIHLVAQGQLVLRACQNVLHFKVDTAKNRPVAVQTLNQSIEKLFFESCIILADHHVLNNNWDEASTMYKESKLSPLDVISRKDILSSNKSSNVSAKEIHQGLLYFLRGIVQIENKKFLDHRGNPEDVYNASIGGLITAIVELTQNLSPEELPQLLLSQSIVQYFASDRCLSSIEKTAGPYSNLAQALIWLQRGNCEKAHKFLDAIDSTILSEIMLNHLHLLVDRGSLSELALILSIQHPDLLVTGLLKLINNPKIVPSLKVDDIHQMLFDLLPKRTGVVQTILESLVSNDTFSTIAFEMLCVIYLDQLQCVDKIPCYLSKEPVPFINSHPNFLNNIPQSKSFTNEQQLLTLKKLQGLVWNADAGTKTKFRKLIAHLPATTCGLLSLQIICALSKNEVLMLLIQNAPIAIVPYIKECGDVTLSEGRFVLIQLKNMLKNDSSSFLYDKVTRDVVQYLSERLPLKDLLEVMPESYLRLAYDTFHAAHIKYSIMTMRNIPMP